MSQQKMKVLGPKVYDPSLARKLSGRPEEILFERSKEPDEMQMPDSGEEFEEYNTKDVLEEALFQNVPDVVLQLAQERHKREVCNARLQKLRPRAHQDIEKELQQFSEEFGSQLHDLRNSMKELVCSLPDFRPLQEREVHDDQKREKIDLKSLDFS